MNTWEKGLAAEEIAARFLLSRGYTIRHRNMRIGRLEIDIVAQINTLVVLVEVRSRRLSAIVTALDSISSRKQRSIRQAAQHLWTDFFAKEQTISGLRVDAISVTYDNADIHVEHVEGIIEL